MNENNRCKSFLQVISYIERNYGDRTAFQWYNDKTDKVESKSYTEFAADVRKYASYILSVYPDANGKHIAILAPNSYHFIVAVYGILVIGAAVVPLNVRERAEVIRWELEYADVDAMITDDAARYELDDILSDHRMKILKLFDYPEIIAQKIEDDTDEDRTAMLMFTSGTSGANKCVAFSRKSLILKGYQTKIAHREVEITYKFELRRYLNMLPMYHIFGMVAVLRYCFFGATVNLCNDIRCVFRDLKIMESDFTALVPIFVQKWRSDLQKGKKESLGELKLLNCGGAPIDHEYFRTFVENGIQILFGYGMTETLASGVIHLFPTEMKYGSIGKPEYMMELKFDDGEICIKTELAMQGYYKNPEATAEVLRDGWLHTGDLGYMDEDGYVYITGRKKNLIILSNGENVSPEELEALLQKDENVKEFLVKEKNDKICAEIFCDEDKREEVEAFIMQINKTLPFYKQIVLTEYRTTPFERTSSGKIKRG